MCRRKGTRVTSIPVGRELLSDGDLGDGEGGDLGVGGGDFGFAFASTDDGSGVPQRRRSIKVGILHLMNVKIQRFFNFRFLVVFGLSI